MSTDTIEINIYSIFLISISLSGFLFSIGEFIVLKVKEHNVLLGCIYFIMAYFLFHAYLLHTSKINEYPRLFLTPIPLLGALGIISYKYINLLYNNKSISIYKFRIIIFVQIVALIPLILFYFRTINEEFHFQPGNIQDDYLPLSVRLSVLIQFISLFIFLTLPIIKIIHENGIYKSLNDKRAFIPLLITFCSSIIFPAMVIMNRLWDRKYSHLIISLGVGGLFIGLFFIKKRYSFYFLENLIEDTKISEIKAKKKSQTIKIDNDLIKTNIHELFENQKIYLKEDLTLRELSIKLGLTIHQTSEYLNNILNTNFYQLLGKYRVEEAKRNIQNNPNATLLEIAYSSGFNSKSNFNKIFKEITFLTPKQYKNSLPQKNISPSRTTRTTKKSHTL
jgi:AraC-like DNA-binding protein